MVMQALGGSISNIRLYLFIPLSLIVVWSIAWLSPSPSHITSEIKHRLPSVKIDYHPNREAKTHYNQRKVALLVETRTLGHTTPLLLHMISIVPPDWRFMFLGSDESVKQLNASLPVQMHQSSGKLDVRVTPKEFPATSPQAFNEMFTSPRFYDEVVYPAEWLLVFHSDSIMCANSNRSVDDWLDYDWVGAPWRSEDQFGGNGGLSLRRVSKIQRVLKFQARFDDSGDEDKWLIERLGLLPGANMANASIEAEFCVGNVWHDRPVGYHLGESKGDMAPDIWNDPLRRKKIYDYCPEIKMIMDMKLERQRCKEEELAASSMAAAAAAAAAAATATPPAAAR